MRIGIIGPGSIGLLFACYLNKRNQVTVYCRTKDQVEHINQYGVILKHKGTEEKITVKAEISNLIADEELVIIAVKQYHLAGIETIIHEIPAQTPLMFIQNGIGHLEYIEKLPHKTIYLGIVEHGAYKEGDNRIHHTGEGQTKVALFRGTHQFSQTMLNQLQSDQFPVLFVENYRDMLVEKLVVNAVINPLTAILKVRNGELITNQYYLHLVNLVFNEVADILKIADREKAYNHVLKICENTQWNQSSMLKDILNHRPTEIDGIIGALIELAQKAGIPVPVLQFINSAIKGMEN